MLSLTYFRSHGAKVSFRPVKHHDIYRGFITGLVQRTVNDKATEPLESGKIPKNDMNPGSLFPGELLVGRPDPVSNLRPAKFYIPSDETKPELEYRTLRDEAHKFNHNFWKENNTKFSQEKLLFEKKAIEERGNMDPEDLSEFYKDYLQRNRAQHIAYNREWWSRNFNMLIPGLKALVISLFRRKARVLDSITHHVEQGFYDPATNNAQHRGKHKIETDNVNRRKEKIRSYY